jgi:hypothetical protein
MQPLFVTPLSMQQQLTLVAAVPGASSAFLVPPLSAAAADCCFVAPCRVPGLFAFLRRRYPQICSPVEKRKAGGSGQRQQPVDNLYIGEATPSPMPHTIAATAATAADELVSLLLCGLTGNKTDT